MYVIARYFDQLKVDIDQFVNVLKTNYTSFDQAPDALLDDVDWDCDDAEDDEVEPDIDEELVEDAD